MHPNENREGATAKRSRVWWIMLVIITIGVALVFVKLGTVAVDESHIRERLETEVFAGATVVEYDVVSSVPLGVQLIVQSESRITPEEVEAAHLLINALYDKDVEVKVIARQIVRPTIPLAANITALLQAALPKAIIADVVVGNQDGILVTATVKDSAPPQRATLLELQDDFGRLFDSEVRLNILFQQMLKIGADADT